MAPSDERLSAISPLHERELPDAEALVAEAGWNQTADDWAVILVVDADHRVIASSDRFHVPLGARLPCPDGPEVQRLRFAAREYLAMRCPSRGYQGYAGPGWCGLVMLPVEHAFAREAAAPLRALGDEVRSAIMSSPTLFSE